MIGDTTPFSVNQRDQYAERVRGHAREVFAWRLPDLRPLEIEDTLKLDTGPQMRAIDRMPPR